MKRIALLLVILLTLPFSVSQAQPQILTAISAGSNWNATGNSFGGKVMAVRDIGDRQFVYGEFNAMVASNGTAGGMGVWFLKGADIQVGAMGGLADYFLPKSDADTTDGDYVNYVVGSVSVLAFVRPFDLPGGLCVTLDYDNPIRENAFESTLGGSVSVFYDF